MTGKHRIIIKNAYIKYDFTIYRNITIIRGDSATGKTTLVNMIRTYNEQEDVGISVQSDVPIETVYGRNWKKQLDEIANSIIFIDEQSRFIKSKEFADAIKGSDNYFVLITREKLSELPYSITEIYGIRCGGEYAHLIGEYTQNEFYRIYSERPSVEFVPDVIITEDSGAGYDFWCEICKNAKCESARGKSNVIARLKELSQSGQRFLTIVDGAAYGPEMEEMIQYIRYTNSNVELYAPESFEYLLLTSKLFNSSDIDRKCKYTEEYADSKEYMSWEQFYTELIIKETRDMPSQYNKKKLNAYYLSERNRSIILQEIPEILRMGIKVE